MKIVIRVLEGEEDNLIIPPNPFASMKHTISSVRRRKASVQPKLMIIPENEQEFSYYDYLLSLESCCNKLL